MAPKKFIYAKTYQRALAHLQRIGATPTQVRIITEGRCESLLGLSDVTLFVVDDISEALSRLERDFNFQAYVNTRRITIADLTDEGILCRLDA